MVSINQVPLTSWALVPSAGTGTDDYFQMVLVSALLGVLKEGSSVGSLPQIMLAFITVEFSDHASRIVLRSAGSPRFDFMSPRGCAFEYP
ncbi:hypothetical protein C8R44DRAFT_896027 [Mycena epipterygia]|nr:hypothetical protein C8R44DRAFT_896027 [Mycena epipterygia]